MVRTQQRMVDCNDRREAGFTLVELLVVIGIIALLISVLLPALTKAKRAGEAVTCLANLKTLGQATCMYVNDYSSALPPNLFNWIPPGKTTAMGLGETWDVKMLPYLGTKLVYDAPSGNMVAPANYRLKALECPADYRYMYGKPWILRSYVAIRTKDKTAGYTAGPYGTGAYVGTMWDGNSFDGPIKVTHVRKPSECVFLMENWVTAADLSDANRQFRATFGINDPPLGSGASPLKEALNGTRYHNKRIHFLFVDGHAASENPNDFHKYKWFWRRY